MKIKYIYIYISDAIMDRYCVIAMILVFVCRCETQSGDWLLSVDSSDVTATGFNVLHPIPSVGNEQQSSRSGYEQDGPTIVWYGEYQP